MACLTVKVPHAGVVAEKAPWYNERMAKPNRTAARLPARAADPITTLDIVFPNQTNQYGTMFGGQVISMADKAAYFAANKYSGTNVVTASMERFDFRNPIRSGDTIEAIARVVYTGRTSMVVKCEIWADSLQRKERLLCTSGYLTMIALGADGKPTPVPPLKIRTRHEQTEWNEAGKIRKEHAR
jgi:uncharacterized protein (TIGR00369 family)